MWKIRKQIKIGKWIKKRNQKKIVKWIKNRKWINIGHDKAEDDWPLHGVQDQVKCPWGENEDSYGREILRLFKILPHIHLKYFIYLFCNFLTISFKVNVAHSLLGPGKITNTFSPSVCERQISNRGVQWQICTFVFYHQWDAGIASPLCIQNQILISYLMRHC